MEPELFVDTDLASDFLCQICLYVVKDPIEHKECSKLYCRSCIDELRRNECPNCRAPVEGRMKCMNPIVKERIYTKLEMKCSYEGCTATFRWSEQSNHENQCIYRPENQQELRRQQELALQQWLQEEQKREQQQVRAQQQAHQTPQSRAANVPRRVSPIPMFPTLETEEELQYSTALANAIAAQRIALQRTPSPGLPRRSIEYDATTVNHQPMTVSTHSRSHSPYSTTSTVSSMSYDYAAYVTPLYNPNVSHLQPVRHNTVVSPPNQNQAPISASRSASPYSVRSRPVYSPPEVFVPVVHQPSVQPLYNSRPTSPYPAIRFVSPPPPPVAGSRMQRRYRSPPPPPTPQERQQQPIPQARRVISSHPVVQQVPVRQVFLSQSHVFHPPYGIMYAAAPVQATFVNDTTHQM